MRAQLANLSQCYVRLAEQADHNSRTDIVYESAHSNRSGDLGGKPA